MTTFNILVVLIAFGLPGAQKQTAEAPPYNESADARTQISAAIAEASRTRKNVVLDFGANWCGDCRALDEQMHRPPLSSLIAKSFVVVKIDVGRFSRNLDVAEQYHVPIRHGIPALAVLDKNGALLYAMDQGQFADARHMSFESITAFFEKWKPKD
jgi:protein disulfide-isomerase